MLKPHLNMIIKHSGRVFWSPYSVFAEDTIHLFVEVDRQGKFIGEPFARKHSELKDNKYITGTYNRLLGESEDRYFDKLLFRMIIN